MAHFYTFRQTSSHVYDNETERECSSCIFHVLKASSLLHASNSFSQFSYDFNKSANDHYMDHEGITKQTNFYLVLGDSSDNELCVCSAHNEILHPPHKWRSIYVHQQSVSHFDQNASVRLQL